MYCHNIIDIFKSCSVFIEILHAQKQYMVKCGCTIVKVMVVPSLCEWKMSTDTLVEGWRVLATCKSCFVEEKAAEIIGSSFIVMLDGRAGSSTNTGAMMQWDNRHSGLLQNTHFILVVLWKFDIQREQQIRSAAMILTLERILTQESEWHENTAAVIKALSH